MNEKMKKELNWKELSKKEKKEYLDIESQMDNLDELGIQEMEIQREKERLDELQKVVKKLTIRISKENENKLELVKRKLRFKSTQQTLMYCLDNLYRYYAKSIIK